MRLRFADWSGRGVDEAITRLVLSGSPAPALASDEYQTRSRQAWSGTNWLGAVRDMLATQQINASHYK